MGYVGNQQAEGFVQRPTKQDLTGATGTSLTLSHAVSKEEDIDLYINNVKQEPTTAYTVADTAVTLTGSVVATDDIYVVYNSLALQTVTPPDGSVTSAKLVYPLTTFSSTGIDDNATSTAMTLDSSGNVGIGTSSPIAYGLHINKSSGASGLRIQTGSNTFDLTQSGTEVYITNNTSAGSTIFYNNALERMRIDSSGNLLVGQATQSFSGNGRVSVLGASGAYATSIGAPSTGGSYYYIDFRTSGGTQTGFIASSNGTSTIYSTTSDYRLKENVTDITGATERLKQLNPVRFNFIADADTTVDGFLAHEVQTVVPEAITGTKDAVDDDGNPEYQGIDQSKLVPLLVATIQELEARIAALEAN